MEGHSSVEHLDALGQGSKGDADDFNDLLDGEETAEQIAEDDAVLNAVTQCTRRDLEEVISVGLRPLYAQMERLEHMMEHMMEHGPKGSTREERPAKRRASKADYPSFKDEFPSVRPDAVAGSTEVNTESSPELREVSSVIENAKQAYNAVDAQHNHHHSFAGEFVHDIIVENEMVLMGASAKHSYNKALLEWLVRVSLWWDGMEEPERTGCLHAFVHSSSFETVSSFVIVLNSAFVAYTSEWEMQNVYRNNAVPDAHVYIEYFFIAFYSIELFLRVAAHRLYFFVNEDMKWNLFDAVLVSVSLFDLLLNAFMSSDGDNNLVFMRVLRLCKLAKTLRAFRAMRFFKDLAIMMESFKTSLISLFWAMVMLILILYVFALIFLQGLADYMILAGDDVDPLIKTRVLEGFGTMYKSMLSLYMSMTGGNDWIMYHDLTVKAGVFYSSMFLLFTFWFTFALFNILTGIFVEKAVAAASPDRAELVMMQHQKSRQDALEFRRLCDVFDDGHTGTITWKEFQERMQNEAMVAYMASLGLEVYEVELFFSIVAGSAGEGAGIPIDRFCQGCMHMKGAASGIDVQRQLFEMHLLHQDLKDFEAHSLRMLHVTANRIEHIVAQVVAPDGRHIIEHKSSPSHAGRATPGSHPASPPQSDALHGTSVAPVGLIDL